jgi:cytochrome c5
MLGRREIERAESAAMHPGMCRFKNAFSEVKSVSSQAEKSVITTAVTLLSALVLLATVLFMVAILIGAINRVAPDDGSRKQAAVLDRIKPVARVALAQPKVPGAEVKLSGQEVYNKVCAACHAAGVLGAPKVGAKDQWEPRFAQGLDTLVTHAVTGLRAMPAKGGDPSLTEANIKDSIVYMLGETGIKTDTAPAAAAPAPAAPAAAAPAAVQAPHATFDSYAEKVRQEAAPATAPAATQ